nr:MAG TPA: SCO PROTEIN HOMEOSTASIS, CHAPERONE, HOMEOSTASIS.4A [Caudoviricetes sp.]
MSSKYVTKKLPIIGSFTYLSNKRRVLVLVRNSVCPSCCIIIIPYFKIKINIFLQLFVYF